MSKEEIIWRSYYEKTVIIQVIIGSFELVPKVTKYNLFLIFPYFSYIIRAYNLACAGRFHYIYTMNSC